MSGRGNDWLAKWLINEMPGQHTLIDEMTGWHNELLLKWFFDQMIIRWNDALTK